MIYALLKRMITTGNYKNGEFTTPTNCVEVIMSIKYGSKDSLNMHTV